MKQEYVHKGIIGIFVGLYALVATISMINSVAFFDLAHNGIMSWVLAIGFELGAAASLAAIIILDRTNKNLVWGLFILLTAFQMMANSFHAYINLEEYMGWIELFGLERQPVIAQKRILSIISGAVLPLVALGFIKSLVDYIRPDVEDAANSTLTGEEKELSAEEIIAAYENLIEAEAESLSETISELPIAAVTDSNAIEASNEKISEVQTSQKKTTKQPVAKPAAQKNFTHEKSVGKPSQTEKKKVAPVQGKGNVTVSKTVQAKPVQNAEQYKP